jgi:tetratricopeptide (TPR) repeat protein
MVALVLSLPGRALAHGSHDSRIATLTDAITASPDSMDLYLQRGELYQLERHWDLATRDFRRAEVLSPEDPRSRMCLASLLVDTARPAAALEQLTVSAPSESNPEFWYLCSRAYADLEGWTDAIQCLDKALSLWEHPRPDRYVDRVHLVLARNPRDWTTALEGLDAGIARLGPLPSLGLLALDLEVEAGAYAAALSRLDAIANWLGRPEFVLARRGEILELADRRLEASVAYTEALDFIEKLSARRRCAPATRELEQRVRSALADVAPPEQEGMR